MENLKDYINEARKYMRYDISVNSAKDGKYLDILDNFSDNHLHMFISPDGIVATRNSYDFGEINDILKGLKLSGNMIAPKDVNLEIGNPHENDHAMDCGAAGKRLFKKFEVGKKYRISTGEDPHGKDFKIQKV